MIPLIIFFGIWAFLVMLFCIMSLITVMMSMRFGISGSITVTSIAIFVMVIFLVLAATGIYLAQVDWTQSVQLLPTSNLPGLGI